EFGTIEGVMSPIDILEAIADEFTDESKTPDIIVESDDSWRVDRAADLHHLELLLNTDGLVDEEEDYSTVAGYLLKRFGLLPQPEDSCELKQAHATFRFTVLRVEGRRIAAVRIERLHEQADENNNE